MKFHRSKSALGVLLAIGGAHAQLAKGATKFLGNITTSGGVRSDFGTYWNQITPENESKWGSVEYTRGTFDWSGVDRVANYAKQQGIPWKFHTMVWGGQYPSWMDNLSQADQLTEITRWYDAAAARYPDVPMIDVVNEAMVGHNPAPWKAALGGDGASGVDWIVKSFKMARERWPKAILIYNDFNILEWNYDDAVTFISKMVKAGAPIDAIGSQSHALTIVDSTTLRKRIDGMVAATGLPMYITEFDIGELDDTKQKDYYSKLFPVMWNHPMVAGVTLWGYISGKTWVDGTGLMSDANVDRPAMTWLKDYVANHKNPPVPKVGSDANTTATSAGGPCDIYGANGTPCVAAYSTTRALYGAYTGNLYQVRRSDNTTKNIGLVSTGGVADAASQDNFCGVAGSCRISIIYDQSGKGNHLTKAPGGNKDYGPNADSEAVADALPIQLNGHKVYGVHITPGSWTAPGQVGYRNTNTNGIAKGDDPESMYMITDGTYVNGACCFDFGNAEMDPLVYTSMDAIYFGTNNWWDVGAGTGPWIMADLENGVYNHGGATGDARVHLNPNGLSLAFPFVTALLKNNKAGATTGGPFTIKGGNAQSGALTTMWDGARPDGYGSLGKAGGIVLGIGGDNSSGAQGNFYEGVMTTGFASSAADDAVQENIVAAGYGRTTTIETVPVSHAEIVNGKFDQGTLGWTFNVWGGGAQGSVVDGEYRIAIDSIGTHNSDIQAVQNGIILVQGKTYQVTFDAYSTGNRTLEANVEQDASPWSSYLPVLQSFDLTSAKTTFSYTFTMTQPTDSNGRVSFNAGGSTEPVFIDNVSINGVPAGLRPRGGAFAGTPRWSRGVLSVPGLESGMVQIVDSRGRSRIVHVARGLVNTGMLPAGIYQASLFEGGPGDHRTFTVLR